MESIIFLGLNLAAWITIVTVLAMFLSLLFTRLPEDVAFLSVGTMYQTALSAAEALKDAGISLAAIGLFSMVKAQYSFKWMISPLIDQYKLPLFSKLGRRRGWAVFIKLLLI